MLNETQAMLWEVAAEWFAKESPVAKFRAVRDAELPLGYDPAAWSEIVEMGWSAILVPESQRGLGLGLRAISLICELSGRHLSASPLVASSVGAVTAILTHGSAEQKDEWLPKLADGSIIGTLAVDEGDRHQPYPAATVARANGEDFVISGEKSWVIEGMAADIMIVSAVLMGADDANGSIGLFAVPTATPGVTRTPLNAIDHRGVAHVGFKHVVLASHHLIGRTGLTPSGIDAILDPLRVCIAAEMLGVADAAFQMTLDYLKMREQFGQLIGSFQALQHRASEMYMELEICRSVIEAAILACEEGNPQSTALVALAKCKMGEALDLVTNELIQMHGGIGMTDEHDAGLFFKRARVLRNLLGTPAFHRERFAGLKGI